MRQTHFRPKLYPRVLKLAAGMGSHIKPLTASPRDPHCQLPRERSACKPQSATSTPSSLAETQECNVKWDIEAQSGAGSSQLGNFHLSTVVDPDLPEHRPAARASGSEQPSSCTLPRGRCHLTATEGRGVSGAGKSHQDPISLLFLQHGRT